MTLTLLQRTQSVLPYVLFANIAWLSTESTLSLEASWTTSGRTPAKIVSYTVVRMLTLLYLSAAPDACQNELSGSFSSPIHRTVLLVFLSVSAAKRPDRIYPNDTQINHKHHECGQAVVVQPAEERLLDHSLTNLPNPITFRSITINYTDREPAEKTDTFLRRLIRSENALLRSSVREVSVDGHDYFGNWTLVDAVFQSLHNLEVVHWHNDQPLPSAVLNSLEALNPSAKLHYRISFYSP
jgi:hypothetical protein